MGGTLQWCIKVLVTMRIMPLPLFLAMLFLSIAFQSTRSGIQVVAAQGPAGQELTITIAPPVLVADGNAQQVIYLQLLGSGGLPRLSSTETEVSLISSNSLVARVPDSVHIQAGRSYVVANVTTTSLPGKVTVTAATGNTLATGELTVVSPLEATAPLRLALYAAPSSLLAGVLPTGILSVLLIGANGNLVPAPEDLTLVLSSSNPEVVGVAERVSIPRGAHFVNVPLIPLAPGSAVLSAVRSGFVSEFIEVHVVEAGETAQALMLHLSPPILSANSGRHQAVVIQAVDGQGKPVPFPLAEVHLASSSPATAEVIPIVEVPSGLGPQYVVAELDAKLPGTTSIIAAATGLRPAAAPLVVQGQRPTQLKAYLGPGAILGIEDPPGLAVVQVQDENGLPVNFHEDISVNLVGGGGESTNEVVIPTGRSFVALQLGRLQPSQQVEFWLISPDLAPARLSVKPLTLPTNVELTASKRPLSPGDRIPILLKAGSSGTPLARAKITWTVVNGTLSDASPETDDFGVGRVTLVAESPGDGTLTATVSKLGYDDANGQAQIAVVAPPEAKSPPSLFGIRVVYLFLALPLILLAYLAFKLLPVLRRQA